MTASLEQLIAQLENSKPYTPLSDEEIRRQASQRYQGVYDQKRLSAQQTYETNDAALARELAGLQKNYDQQRQSSAAQTQSAYSQADRHALSRGMQRSSYNEANLTGIRLAGASAQRSIDQEQAEAEADIGHQRTQLSDQLSDTLAQLGQSQQDDELAYADELAAREYDRAAESRNTYSQLAMQLYEYRHELEKEAAEQARWLAEFNARYGGGSTRSSSGGKKKTAAAAAPVQTSVSKSGAANSNRKMADR